MWNLRRRMRKAMKNTTFHPPGDPDPTWRAEQQRQLNYCAAKAREMGQAVVIMDKFAETTPEGNKLFDGIQPRLKPVVGPITEHLRGANIDVGRLPPPLELPNPWLGTDPRLPRECPLCGGPNTPSMIDDRIVACYACGQVYLTAEALNDPNIQRDLTHCKAGISCKNHNDCEEDNDEND